MVGIALMRKRRRRRKLGRSSPNTRAENYPEVFALSIVGREAAIEQFKAVTFLLPHAKARNEIIHSYRWNIVQQIRVPLLGRFHAGVTQKVSNLQNVPRCVIN